MAQKRYEPWDILRMISISIIKTGDIIVTETGTEFKLGKDKVLRYTNCKFDVDKEMPSSYLIPTDTFAIKKQNISIEVAAEAFKQGKNIRCEYTNWEDDELIEIDHFTQNSDKRKGCMTNDAPEITFYMINVGKWYIDEEEE